MSELTSILPPPGPQTGIDAAALVIPGEDAAALESLAVEYHLQFQPAGPLQRFLVDSLVHADWQLRRLHRVEAQLWHNELKKTRESFCGINEDAPLGHVFERARNDFHYLQRRLDSTERSYFRALHQLQRRTPASLDLPPADRPQSAENKVGSSKLGSFSQIQPDGRTAKPPQPPPGLISESLPREVPTPG